MIGRFAQIRGCRERTTAEVGTGMSDAVAEQCAHVLAAASASGSDGSAARVRAAELRMRCVVSDRHAVCAHAVCRVLCGVSRAYGVCVCVYARNGAW